jgi:hypothetical protein
MEWLEQEQHMVYEAIAVFLMILRNSYKLESTTKPIYFCPILIVTICDYALAKVFSDQKCAVQKFHNTARVLGLAGNTQRQQIPTQSFEAGISILTVNNDDYLRHEFSDRQIPKVLLTCFTKACRTFIRKLWNFLGQRKKIVAQTLALGVWQGQCRVGKGV